MKFTHSWLTEHLDTDASVEDISIKLSMIGLELEELIDLSEALAPFTVAQIVSTEKHPDADRLKVCKVDTGDGIIDVVCGAPNAREGIKVVLAQPGAIIPSTGDKLKKGKIRGVESFGMMCSAAELGLGDNHDGIIELDTDAAPGSPAADVLGHDPIYHIAITPNRPDCLGVRGVARDLAAARMGTLRDFDKTASIEGSFKSPIQVLVDHSESKDACPTFVGRYIKDVKNGDSPHWVKERLTAIGLRPITALVDMTNLISYELGRPLHVFDADKVKGDLHARLATQGETIQALDEKIYELDAGTIVIADDSGPVAIAGIMGGLETGCTETTTNVVVESALFDPIRIATAGRKLQIDSDARFRFERGVDPASCVSGAEYATRLILDWCGGAASELMIAGAEPDWQAAIVMRPERVAQRGGIDLSVAEIEDHLRRLGCIVAEHGDGLLVTPPSWRVDIDAEHDLIEEVIRIHGFENVQAVPVPRASMPKPILTLGQRRAGFTRRALAGRGLYEAVTWSFLPHAHAKLFGGGKEEMILANPISSDLDAMRPSILPNLIAAAARNADRGQSDFGLFEVGPQFHGEHPGEQQRAAAGIRYGRTGARHWAEPPRAVDAFDAKADAIAGLRAAGAPADNLQISTDAPEWYHPGRSGALRLGPNVLAYFGELHPDVLKAMNIKGPVCGFEIFLDRVPKPKGKKGGGTARKLLRASPYQAVSRDFAFVVESTVAAGDLVRAAKGADKSLITDVTLFDLFEGGNMEAGKKSLAISVTLQPTDKTLTDAEIDAVTKAVVAAVVKATGGELRG